MVANVSDVESLLGEAVEKLPILSESWGILGIGSFFLRPTYPVKDVDLIAFNHEVEYQKHGIQYKGVMLDITQASLEGLMKMSRRHNAISWDRENIALGKVVKDTSGRLLDLVDKARAYINSPFKEDPQKSEKRLGMIYRYLRAVRLSEARPMTQIRNTQLWAQLVYEKLCVERGMHPRHNDSLRDEHIAYEFSALKAALDAICNPQASFSERYAVMDKITATLVGRSK